MAKSIVFDKWDAVRRETSEEVWELKDWIKTFALIIVLLTACSQEPDKSENGLLYIGTLHELQHADVRTNWVDAFQHQHPGIDVEFLSVIGAGQLNYRDPGQIDGAAKIDELLGGTNPPDIVALGYDDFKEAIEQNLLAPLNPMMNGSRLTEDMIEPAIVDSLRGPDGQLYGLAPVIRSSALVYNKDLFDRAQIDYPTDGMTWNEVFELAERMTFDNGENKVHGFTFSEEYGYPEFEEILSWYAAGSGLAMHDEQGQTMAVNNGEWRALFERILSLTANGIYPVEAPETAFRENPFLSGDAAMTVMRDAELYEFIQLQNDAASQEGFEPFQWDIVTVPVHEHTRDQGAGISIEPIFAISGNARNPEIARNFLEFIHSDQWVSMNVNPNQLLTFDHASDAMDASYNKDTFFQLRPVEQPLIRSGSFSRNPYVSDVERLGGRLFTQMYMGMMTVDEMLAKWEAEGNLLLQEINGR